MAQVTETEENLLPNGGGRMVFGQNLKIFVIFGVGAPIIMQNGGQNEVLQTNPTTEQGGKDSKMQADPIQYTGGKDTVL